MLTALLVVRLLANAIVDSEREQEGVIGIAHHIVAVEQNVLVNVVRDGDQHADAERRPHFKADHHIHLGVVVGTLSPTPLATHATNQCGPSVPDVSAIGPLFTTHNGGIFS